MFSAIINFFSSAVGAVRPSGAVISPIPAIYVVVAIFLIYVVIKLIQTADESIDSKRSFSFLNKMIEEEKEKIKRNKMKK